MACAGTPNAITGGVELTSAPYADGDRVVYQCNSGYVMSGVPYVTCSTGAYTGTYPTCTLEVADTITVNNDDAIPSWLLYLIAALVGLIILLILTCIFVACYQFLGCGGGGNLFGSSNNSGGGNRSRDNRYDPERSSPRECKTFPRRYLYDDSGRRFHYDDVGRICYHNHKHQNGKAAVAPSDQNGSVTLTNDSTVKTAKDVAEWMPHAKPVRYNNTSTK